jgi:hypothetical protein
MSKEPFFMSNLSKVDVLARYGDMETAIEHIDTCFDLHDLGCCDEKTQESYLELTEIPLLQFYGLWLESRKKRQAKTKALMDEGDWSEGVH